MIKRFALIGTFTLVIAAAALLAYAQTHVSIGIGTPFYPPVGVVSAAPYPGYVWRPAHHVWTAFGYQLIPGAWVPAPYYAPYYSPYYAPYAYPYAYAPPPAPYYYPFPGYVGPQYVGPQFGVTIGFGLH